MPVMPARLQAARPLARTIRWPALVASAVPALWFVWEASGGPGGSIEGTTMALRLGAVSLAIGLAFVLDDPTEDLTAPVAISLITRRALRIALTLPVAIVAWLVLFMVASRAPGLTEPLSMFPLLSEMSTLACVALAGAAIGARRLADGLGGPAGAAAVVMTAVAGAVFPWGSSLLVVLPGTARYAETRLWWLGLLGIALSLLVGASHTHVTSWRRALLRGVGAASLSGRAEAALQRRR